MYHPKCEDLACISDNFFGEVVETTKKVDEVVLVVGLDQTQEKEERDRIQLTLPSQREKLVYQVSCTAKIPVVLIILSGGPVDVSFAVNDPQISSIIWAGYPGRAGGRALAEIIFGDYNPGILSFHPFVVVSKHTIGILYFYTIPFSIVHVIQPLFSSIFSV